MLSNYALFLSFFISLVRLAVSDVDPCGVYAVVGISFSTLVLLSRTHIAVARFAAFSCLLAVALTGAAAAVGLLGQIPPAEGACILSISLALLTREKDGVSEQVPLSFAFLTSAILCIFVNFLGLLYGTDGEVYEKYISINPWSSFTFAALVIHIVFRHPLQWPVNVLIARYPSVRLSRYYLLLCSLLPVMLGGLFLNAVSRGWFDMRTAAIVFVFLTVVVFWTVILKGALWAYRINQARDLAVVRLAESWKSRESYFRRLVDDSPVILYLTNASGACTFLSKKWEEYTGRPAPQDLGYGWLEVVHPEDRKRMSSIAYSSPSNSEGYLHEYRMRRADGEYRWVISTGFPRFDDNRNFMGLLGNVVDVHERKIQFDNLKLAKQTAEISNQTKSQFLANMSHEIRTPLNAILGFASMCSADDCSEVERVDYLRRIRSNGDHLLKLIDDILDLAKMESGAGLVQKSQFSVDKMIDEIVGSLRALASQKGLRLDLDRAENLPAVVYSDPHRIKQIVNNLVGNAIKFTAQGSVQVGVRFEASMLRIVIADTGVGMTDEQSENLFKPFSQGDSSVTRKFGGTGLGLHLSRKLAQSIGGDVVLKESTPGSGSIFEFSFAIGTEEERAPRSSKKMELRPIFRTSERSQAPKLFGKKILVAEDSVDSKELIHVYFRSTGAQIVSVDNGADAVSAALRENPDLILMDVQMPGMDGLEATRRLRQQGFTRPIVALTAHALQDEVDHSFEAGCNYHLTKPVAKDMLLSLVSDLVQHSMV